MRDAIEVIGTVVQVLGNNNYRVEIGDGEGDAKKILPCHLGGKMRRFKINIIVGDEVTMEVPAPYDKGRIIFRGKKPERGAAPIRTKNRKRPKGKGGRR